MNWNVGNTKTLSGAGTWNKTGTGTVSLLNSVVTATGQVNVQQGTLRNDGNSVNWSASTVDLDISTGATFDMRADSVWVDSPDRFGFHRQQPWRRRDRYPDGRRLRQQQHVQRHHRWQRRRHPGGGPGQNGADQDRRRHADARRGQHLRGRDHRRRGHLKLQSSDRRCPAASPDCWSTWTPMT